MSSQAVLQFFFIHSKKIALFVPAGAAPVQQVHSPYWAKVWPAALGLCQFLHQHLHYIQHKKIAEIAAGLGLPSIFAAPYAAAVYCSDIEPAAVALVRQSVQYHTLQNVHCSVAGWNDYLQMEIPDTVLLSDVNYEPEQFDQLFAAIHYYLQQHCTVILSSPQRLMAKPFIERLLPFCNKQQEVLVQEQEIKTAISIFVLQLQQARPVPV